LSVGQKINISEINLLKKFNIKPYVHEVVVKQIYMSGRLYGSEILKINDTVLKERVLQGIKNVASFSLGTGIATKASAPHVVMNALTNLLGLKNLTGLDVPQLRGGSGGGAPASNASAPAEDKKAGGDKKDEKKGGDKKDDKKGGKEDKKKEPERIFFILTLISRSRR
jgi:hypothetical protein